MAAGDFFIKMDGIKGESADEKHKGEIDVVSWGFGCAQTIKSATGGGSGAGKVAFEDFTFSMQVNKASPEVFAACATGKHIPKVLFVGRKAGGKQQEYLKIELSDVFISSYKTSGSADSDGLPVDEVTLKFDKFKVDYAPQNDKGNLEAPISAGWDLKKNVKV